MKKKVRSIYGFAGALALAICVLASCAQPEFVVELSHNAISIQAHTYIVETCEEGDSVKTKAPIPTGVFPDQPFVMSASFTPSGGSSATFFTGITFSKTGDVWKASPTKYWPHNGQTMFLALSADGLGLTPVWNADAGTGFTISSMPDNRSAQVDIMYGGTGNLSQNSGAAVMSFKHAQSLLHFTGVCDVAYNSSTNVGVTITSITMSALRYRGSFSVSQAANATLTPTWSASTTGAATAYSGTGNLTTSAADLGVGYMVYPQSPVAITINYTLHNGKDASGNNADLARSFSFTPSGTWAAGNSYTYAISFAESEISVSASLNAWEAASQPWFYATGDATSWVGANFPFSSATNMWWRPDGSSSYEALTYVEGTWGNSVKLEAQEYYVTVTKSGSNYSVAYEAKIVGNFFDGFEIAPGPLYYVNNEYTILNGWGSSYGGAYGKTNGSTYFSWEEVGRLFDSAGESFSYTLDRDIDNANTLLDGWRVPSLNEWARIVGFSHTAYGTYGYTPRRGSTVNGVAGVRFVMVSRVYYGQWPGLLLFPDGKTMTGATLRYINPPTVGSDYTTTSLTPNELNNYVNQGCVFIPVNGYYGGASYSPQWYQRVGYYEEDDEEYYDYEYLVLWTINGQRGHTNGWVCEVMFDDENNEARLGNVNSLSGEWWYPHRYIYNPYNSASTHNDYCMVMLIR